MTIQESIIFGVISGVLTAATLFLLKEFWVKTLVPWYQGIRYKGADISGSWSANYDEEGTKTTFSVVLTQQAHRIDGSMQFSFISSEREVNLNYDLSGEYWEGYLNLSCRSKDRKIFSHGSLFLKLINNGSGLLGQFSYRHADDKVSTMPIGVERN